MPPPFWKHLIFSRSYASLGEETKPL